MNKFLKLIFFNCFFLYIFSTTVTKIEPSSVILGENVTFTLTVQDYNLSKSVYFYIGEENEYEDIKLECDEEPIDNLLKCSSLITFSKIEYFSNLIKKLYVNNYDTCLTVTIIKPTNIKFLNFNIYINNKNYNNIYIFNIFKFKIYYNDLYYYNIFLNF